MAKQVVIKKDDRWFNTLTGRYVSEKTANKLNTYFKQNPKGTLYRAYNRPVYIGAIPWKDQPQYIKKLYGRKIQTVKTKDIAGRTVYFSPFTKKRVYAKQVKKIRTFDFKQGLFKVSLYRLTADKERVYHIISTKIGMTLKDGDDVEQLFHKLQQRWLRKAIEITKQIAREYPMSKRDFMNTVFEHDIIATNYGIKDAGVVTLMTGRNPRTEAHQLKNELPKAKETYKKLVTSYHLIVSKHVKIYIFNFANEKTKALAVNRLGVFKRNGNGR